MASERMTRDNNLKFWLITKWHTYTNTLAFAFVVPLFNLLQDCQHTRHKNSSNLRRISWRGPDIDKNIGTPNEMN